VQRVTTDVSEYYVNLFGRLDYSALLTCCKKLYTLYQLTLLCLTWSASWDHFSVCTLILRDGEKVVTIHLMEIMQSFFITLMEVIQNLYLFEIIHRLVAALK